MRRETTGGGDGTPRDAFRALNLATLVQHVLPCLLRLTVSDHWLPIDLSTEESKTGEDANEAL